MDETQKELERIENELLAEEANEDEIVMMSIDDILSDDDLNALLAEESIPAFDDPDSIHDPDGEMVYNNYANDYGSEELEEEAQRKKQDDKVIMGLMITASALCVGIIAVLGYWLAVFL